MNQTKILRCRTGIKLNDFFEQKNKIQTDIFLCTKTPDRSLETYFRCRTEAMQFLNLKMYRPHK